MKLSWKAKDRIHQAVDVLLIAVAAIAVVALLVLAYKTERYDGTMYGMTVRHFDGHRWVSGFGKLAHSPECACHKEEI